MAGLFNALNAARTSLEVNQKSIEVVGNNISNVNTPGYSRQYTELSPYPSINFGGFFVGQGVQVANIRRDHSVFLQSQLVGKSSDFGYQDAQTRPLAELERVFAITEENIATDVDRFFDSMQELATNPSDLVLRDQVIQRGALLAKNFNNTIDEINTIGDNINDSMLAKMHSINAKIKEIAGLNDRINTIELNGQDANSPRDQREQLARDLAISVGAQSYYTKDGMMTVQLPGGLPLVQGQSAMELEAVTTGAALRIDLHAGGVSKTLADHNLGGEFQGLVHLKNELIPSLKDDLDKLAYQITTKVNTQHALGAGLDGTTGRNFFADPPNLGAAPPTSAWLDAARTMHVALSKAEHIAAAADPFVGQGDNRNMLILANLDTLPSMDGTDTFNSYYGKLTARIGLETRQNQLSVQGAKDALDQLSNLRDGLSGVSLEEEMINLIQYQRGFESSAKFLTTVDEMMNTLMGIKR